MNNEQILEKLKQLKIYGVTIDFYNCKRNHLSPLPYTKICSREDIRIRIFIDVTKKELIEQIQKAEKELNGLIESCKKYNDNHDKINGNQLYNFLYKDFFAYEL